MITKSENAKIQIEKATQRRLKYLEEYNRYEKIYKKRLESVAENKSAYKIERILTDIQDEIDGVNLLIKIYKKDLEAI
jgi:hypothetical protein